VQGFLTYQIPDDVGVLPLLKTRAILHMFGHVVAALIPSNANLFALVETTTKDPSRQQSNANVGKRRQGPSRMVALMVLHEVLLPIKDAVAAYHYTRPVFSGFMHPHLMFLPV
jgi:hypothetical protein